jgi:predicted DsbA family dithiol-disulfide isomerase
LFFCFLFFVSFFVSLRCFIGLRNLQSAIAQLQKSETTSGTTSHTFDVKFAPFLLRPSGLPEEGIDLAQFISMRFGPAGNDRMRHLHEVGRSCNIEFTTNRLMVPSMRAHRLVEFAQAHALCDAVKLMEAIFSAYFEHGAVINQVPVLADIAESVGLDRAAIVAFLESSDLDDVVFARYREALELGINGVPYFVIAVEQQPVKTAAADDASDDDSSISRSTTSDSASPTLAPASSVKRAAVVQPLREPISFTLSGGQPVAAFVRVFERLAALDPATKSTKPAVDGGVATNACRHGDANCPV